MSLKHKSAPIRIILDNPILKSTAMFICTTFGQSSLWGSSRVQENGARPEIIFGFHTRMGFDIEKGDFQVNGISVHSNYDGPRKDRVLFVRQL